MTPKPRDVAPSARRGRRWRRRLKKRLKTVCGVISFVMFYLTLGVVGAIEQDSLPLLPGMIYAFTFEGLFAFFAWLAGAFY